MQRSAAAFGLLLAYFAVGNSRAEAGCGDYVWINGQPAHASMSHHEQGRGTEQPGRPTCSGPMCSNNSLPPVAPTPRIEVVIEQWAIPVVEATRQIPPMCSFLADSREIGSDGVGLRILRPPR